MGGECRRGWNLEKVSLLLIDEGAQVAEPLHKSLMPMLAVALRRGRVIPAQRAGYGVSANFERAFWEEQRGSHGAGGGGARRLS